MGFTAQTFLFIFLPLSIVAYLLCTRLHRPLLNNILLALMSLAFYVFCGLHALMVFLGLIVFVYLMGVLIGYARQAAGEKASRRWMALGAAALVTLLFLCKYLTFLLDTLSALLPLELSFDGLIVPAGLSFIVFESISYLVDISRGLATPGSPLDAFVFLSLFPKVISGRSSCGGISSPSWPSARNRTLMMWWRDSAASSLAIPRRPFWRIPSALRSPASTECCWPAA